MRVLIVSQYFWPENFRINDLAAELVLRGHDVTVLTGLPNYPDGEIFAAYRDAPQEHLSYLGTRIVRVPMLPRGKGTLRLMLNYLSFAVSAATFGAFRLRKQAFDVVFTYQVSPVTVGLPAALLAKLKKAPMAMWILDLWPDTLHAIGTVRSPRMLAAVGRLVAFIYRRCDLILAQSHSFIPQVRKLAGPDQRIEYFPSWAEDIFREAPSLPAPEVTKRPGTFDVMFAGNIGEAQDFPCILDAAERLRANPGIRWLIVGEGRMTPWVVEQIKSRGLEEQVLMLGRYPVSRMPSFFAQADALLVTLADQPIFAMTIPGKLQSYLAAGLPVVAALSGEGADLIRRSDAGLVSPAGDAAGLAAAVSALAAMTPDRRAEMGANGLRASRREFDRLTILNRVENWLKELAARSLACRQPSQ